MKWYEMLASKVSKFDMLGFFKLIKYMCKGIYELRMSENPEQYVKDYTIKLNRYIQIMGVRYCFSPIYMEEVADITSFSLEMVDAITSILKSNTELEKASTYLRENIPTKDLERKLTNKENLVKELNPKETKYLIINLSDNSIILNAMLCYYLLCARNNFSLEVIMKYSILLKDNYISTILSNFLTKKLERKVYFIDDCTQSNMGSNICMYMTTMFDTVLNPVFLIPINGEDILNINFFRADIPSDDYNMIVELIFGVHSEKKSPIKNLMFLARKSGKYSLSSDFEVVASRLSKAGVTGNYISPDIIPVKGNELGTHFMMNNIEKIINRNVDYDDLRISATKVYEESALYKNAYDTIYMMDHVTLKKILDEYIINQISRLSLIAEQYLSKSVSATEELEFNPDTIWNEYNQLVDTNEVVKILNYVVGINDRLKDVTGSIPPVTVSRCLTILNLWYFSPGWQFKLVGELIGYNEVEIITSENSGYYEIKIRNINTGETLVGKSFNLGMFLPKQSEIKISSSHELSGELTERLRVYFTSRLVSSFTFRSGVEDLILTPDDTIVLITPDNLSPIYINRKTLELDVRYPLPTQMLTVEVSEENKIVVTTTKEFTTTLNDKDRVYLLNEKDSYLVNSKLSGYKTSLFFEEGDDF